MLDLTSRIAPGLCSSINRRQALQAGTLGPVGLSLVEMLSRTTSVRAESRAATSFGAAKQVILFFMWGGPAHQDTWDLKPDGPVELRGEFKPIGTNVSGIHISEHFPHLARHADKLAIIRSVGQEDNNHSTGAHAGLTGRRHELRAENFGARATDFPHFGSVLSRLQPNRSGMPTFVAMPEVIATTAGVITPGQFGGLLGRQYDPFQIADHPDEPEFSVSSLQLPAGLASGRMSRRRELLNQLEDISRLREASQPASVMSQYYERALDMVLSPDARAAFDLSTVTDEDRWRYGWHTFGQSTLLAKRLIDAGVRLVTVYWHREKPTVDSSWDTHGRNFEELKNRLMPAVDRPIAALLEDLAQSGKLDETLIVWNSEFGRTPRINGNGGRDHWGPCNSVVMAGGGVPGGQVFGASDASAAYPTRDKVTQDDIAATIYHLLGMHPETMIHDSLGRPWPVALGQPMLKLLQDECRPEPEPLPPAVDAEPLGPLRQLLRERCRRNLVCEFSSRTSESEWELSGWIEPGDDSGPGGRRPGPTGGSLKPRRNYLAHFDYNHVVVHLAAPAGLSNVVLKLNGRQIDLPPATDSESRTLWQIPLPGGFLKSSGGLEIHLSAPDWNVSTIGVLGDPIEPWYLARHGLA